MWSLVTSAAISAVSWSTLSAANAISYCPSGNVCYSVAVPESSATSGNGDIYFQLSGPTSNEWIALGTGSRMSGSYMFVMYTDGAGNVTISPRKGTDHTPPSEDTSSSKAKLTLLDGSGVSGNTMKANVRCSNCQSWSGGSMSLSSTSSNWIAAWKSGSALDTADKDASITVHDGFDEWQFDLTKATVSTDSNPFTQSSNDDSNETNGGSSGAGNSGGGSGASSGVTKNNSFEMTQKLVSAHGIIMSIAFVILFPLGAIALPLLGNWLMHAIWQMLAFVMMWVGFGLGVAAANNIGFGFKVAHARFGTAIVVLMILQPILGALHHMHYVKHQARGPVSYAHLYYGRALMIMGVINGGLGLQLASAPRNLIIAYAVVSAIVGAFYIGAKIFTVARRRKAGNATGNGPTRIPPRKSSGGSEAEEIRRPYGSQRSGGPGI